MTQRHPELETFEESVDCQDPQEAPFPAGEEEADGDRLTADYSLAQRCVAGDVTAWEDLYAQCHEPLLGLIRGLLNGCGNDDANLADEISARVWYALVANDGQLLSKYDPDCGACLLTFLRALAKDLICRHFRSERRRADRELVAARERPSHHSDDLDQSSGSLKEFLGELSTEERLFFNDYLLENPAEIAKRDGCHLPRTTVWQRTRRLYKQLIRFLGH